ncbi:LacI family DNA-binding transcriptional regulator [Dictyobacter alpinus]|nr:LacI family DNA-binding transcriptional regulator [Dictyobacter alpinus]
MRETYNLPRTRSGQRITMRDIADAAQVSVSTVSRVLNNNEGISQSVREHVLAAARGMGCEFELPRYRGDNQLTRIHLFISTHMTSDSFHSDVVAGIEEECRRNGVQLSYTVTPPGKEGEMLAMEQVKRHREDGLIFVSQDNRTFLEDVAKLNFRIVLINAEHEGLPIDLFVHDNWSGVLEAMNHLIAHGHRSILHLTGAPQRSTLHRRHQAYRTALETAGIVYDPRLVVHMNISLEEAYQWMKEYLESQRPQFTAIFCTNDYCAIGAMRALQEANIRIPEDISVVGYGDNPMAAFAVPPLTSVHIERGEVGRMAARRLIERAASPQLSPIHVRLYARFISRQSVGTPGISSLSVE